MSNEERLIATMAAQIYAALLASNNSRQIRKTVMSRAIEDAIELLRSVEEWPEEATE
jgi:hypothetical protein